MLKYVYDRMIGGIRHLSTELLEDEIRNSLRKYGTEGNKIVTYYVKENIRREEEMKKQMRKYAAEQRKKRK
jgi:hypothetical protein